MLRSSIFYLLVRALNGVLSLAALFILSRALSVAEYGRYALISAAIAVLASIGFQWVNVGVARFYSARRNEEGRLVFEAGRFYLISTVGVLLFCIIAALWSPVSWLTIGTISIVALGSPMLALHALGLQFTNAREDHGAYAVISLLRGLLGLLVAIMLIELGYGGAGAALGFSLAAGLSVCLLLWNLRRTSLIADPELRVDMTAYGLPLALTYLAIMTLDYSGRFIIGAVLGEAAVGPYAAAYDFTQQIIGATTSAIFLAAYPPVVRAWDSGGAVEASHYLNKVLCIFLLLGPVLILPFLVAPLELAGLMFGPQMQAAAGAVIPWVALGVLIGAFKSYYLDVAYQLSKRTRSQLYVTGAMAVMNALLIFLLIPDLGVQGVAVATAVTFLLGAGLSWWWGRKENLYRIKPVDFLFVLGSTVFSVFTGRQIADLVDGDFSKALVATFVGAIVFVVCAVSVDVANSRSISRAFLRRCRL